MPSELKIVFKPDGDVSDMNFKVTSEFITSNGIRTGLPNAKIKIPKEGFRLTNTTFEYHQDNVGDDMEWTMFVWVKDGASITFEPSDSTDFTWTLDQDAV